MKLYRTSFRALGTKVELAARTEAGRPPSFTETAFALARSEIERLEQLLSRFRNDSEVQRINRATGQWVQVSPETWKVLQMACSYFEETQGFFNPFLGYRLAALGYDMSFEKVATRPYQGFVGRCTPGESVAEDHDGMTMSLRNEAACEPYMAPATCPLHLDPATSSARLDAGYQLDLGGIAKGWIVEQAAALLEGCGIRHFLCNAGGDLVCRSADEAPWVVAVAHPFRPNESLLHLEVTNGAVATSGTYARSWRIGQQQAHHLLDPFTGEPAATDVVSCTVLHRSLTHAEVVAKVALLLGFTEGGRWLATQPVRGWVMVSQSGEVLQSCN